MGLKQPRTGIQRHTVTRVAAVAARLNRKHMLRLYYPLWHLLTILAVCLLLPGLISSTAQAATEQDVPDMPEWQAPADSSLGQAAYLARLIAQAREQVGAVRERLEQRARSDDQRAAVLQRLRDMPWQFGPKAIDLGQHAVLELPAHYAYLSAADVAAMRGKSVASARLQPAFIANEDLTAFTRLMVVNTGHVRINTTRLDPAALQSAMSMALNYPDGVPRSGDKFQYHLVSWLLWPSWDANAHRMDWAFRDFISRGGAGMTMRYEVDSVKLGRVTSIIAQGRFASRDHAEQRALLAKDVIDHVMANVHFQPGYGYADARPDDKQAHIVLTDLIAPDYTPPADEGTQPVPAGEQQPAPRTASGAGTSPTLPQQSRESTHEGSGTTDSVLTTLQGNGWGIALLAVVFFLAIWIATRILQRP